MRFVRVVAVMTLVACWPASAYAARSWWGWLEEMSGPGYFLGPMYSVPVVCWGKGRDTADCANFKREVDKENHVLERNAKVKKSLQLTFGVLSSGHNPRFDDLVGVAGEEEANRRRVFAVPLNAAFMLRPHRSVDIGPGAGLIYFKGEGTPSTVRFVLIPVSLSWKFLNYGESAAWKRMVSFEYQGSYITKGFTGADFGGPAALLDAPKEFRHSFGFAVDIGEWFKAR